MNNEIDVLKTQLVQSQSRAFQLISQISSDKEIQENLVSQYKAIIANFGSLLGLTDITPQNITEAITKLTNSKAE